MTPSQKGFAPLIIIVGIVVLLIIAGGAYYLVTLKNKLVSQTQNLVTTPQTASFQQKDKFGQIMQELGCNSQDSCIVSCAKPENREKCQSMMQTVDKSGTSGFNKSTNLLSEFNQDDVPPITANPIDPNRVFAISQFRSNAGHDYSQGAWDGETCRSMKHYFNFGQYQVNGMPKRSTAGPGESNINIYAPFDGTITANEAERTPIGTQVYIASSKNSNYYVKLFHIDLLPSLNIGSTVKSGELIGTIGPKDGMDVSYEAHLPNFKVVYLSVFDYITPQTFAPYATLGFKPGDFVLTREQADTKGYKCNGEQFSNTRINDPKKGLLEGYVSIRLNPYTQQWQNR